MRIPVDKAFGFVNQTVAVQLDKFFRHGFAQALVHGETFALPVQRRTQTAQLTDDLSAGFRFPFPHFFNEFFTSEIVAGNPLFAQHTLDDHLRRNAGVIRPRLPQNVFALHTLVTD